MPERLVRSVLSEILVRYLHPSEDADEVFRESIERYAEVVNLDLKGAPIEVVQRFSDYFTDHVVDVHLEDLVWCSLDKFIVEEAAEEAAKRMMGDTERSGSVGLGE